LSLDKGMARTHISWNFTSEIIGRNKAAKCA
jgi:hypothetical protein